MAKGYIKLWRKSLESPIFRNHKLWHTWQYCLLKATHCETSVMVGYQEVSLLPGQFVFGRKIAAKETGLSEKNIRTSVKYLENSQNVAIKTASKYSIITIVNWVEYQNETAINLASKRPASGQQAATYKNDKNVKNDKKNILGNYSPKFQETFSHFVEMRKHIKKPITDYGIELALKKLKTIAPLEQDQIDIINQSISNSYQGFFPLSKDRQGQSSPDSPALVQFPPWQEPT
jgi:hypothetical protein